MFTGLVEELGTVGAVRRATGYQLMDVTCRQILDDLTVGDSVNVDGACQTVTRLTGAGFTVETLSESLHKTTLGRFGPGRTVNLERALHPGGRLGGHFVQGHVDGVALVESISRDGPNGYLSIRMPAGLMIYVVREGSIAINGVSLTVARLNTHGLTVNVIPLTWSATNLGGLTAGTEVNVEVDIIGRYVARMLGREEPQTSSALSAERLAQWGYEVQDE